MKKITMMLLLGSIATFSFAQDIDKILNAKEVERIESVLASDAMEGRATFSKGIDKAAAFIAEEFKKIGLQTLDNGRSYLQSFSLLRAKTISSSAILDGAALEAKDVAVITRKEDLKVTEQSGYEKVTIAAGANFGTEIAKYINGKKNYFVVVDTSFTKFFPALARYKSQLYKSDFSTIFVLSVGMPKTFTIEAKHEFTEQQLANVAGIIPGKSRKNEYVIFSGHYDHLGISTRNMVNNDSIYNGANDDAAGTTAVIMLAKYFKEMKNNERTLIFVAFTGEEVGGFGANYFSRQYNPEEVIAMFNIEMIGTESKWGKNSAYITGYERTDMGKILQANLTGTDFTFYPDPYFPMPSRNNLFFRSDNATLARLGVPAHTISTSKMENPPEPNYHKASDEVGTLDMENMARIMKAIALSSKGIISGKDTPSRVDVSELSRPRQ